MNTPAKTSVSSEIFMTLRREILSGKFARNEKFPSEQMLVRRFKVARTTVRLALNRLKEDGILETRNGSGTYLSAMANRVTGRLGLIIPHITHGEISPPICSAIAQAASDAGYTILFGDATSEDPETRVRRMLTLAQDYISCWTRNSSNAPRPDASDLHFVRRERHLKTHRTAVYTITD